MAFPSRSTAPSAVDGVQGLPVLAHGAPLARSGSRPRQPVATSPFLVVASVAFDPRKSLGAWIAPISRLNSRACVGPCQRLGRSLTATSS
jgi:hypothetical protein